MPYKPLKERERERQTETETETQRDRERHRQTDRECRSKNTEALNVQQYNAYNTKCNPKNERNSVVCQS